MTRTEAKPFATFPWTRLWWDVRDYLIALPGVELKDFTCDGLNEATIIFSFKGFAFDLHDIKIDWKTRKEYQLFIRDSACPVIVKNEITTWLQDFLPPDAAWRLKRDTYDISSGGLIVVGPSKFLIEAKIAIHPKQYYPSNIDKIKILGGILDVEGPGACVKLCEALGISIWDFNTHKIDFQKVNFSRLENVLGSDDGGYESYINEVQIFRKMDTADFDFYFKTF